MMLSVPEFFIVFSIIALMVFECCLALHSRSWVQVYRPTLFVAVILAFYVLVGPLRAILSAGEVANFIGTSGTIYRETDHRSVLFWGWLGAFIFYGSMLIGFHCCHLELKPHRLITRTNLHQINRLGQVLCLTGLIPYLVVNGGFIFHRLNPFAGGSISQVFMNLQGLNIGGFDNYFYLAINLLIPGIIAQFAVWLRRRKQLWIVLLWLLVATLIFLSEAFRYRILLLAVPLLLLWFFYCKRRPMLVMLLAFMFIFVGVNGAIGAARTTMRGLDLERITAQTPAGLLTASFEEAGVFFTTSLVIDSVPARFPFIHLEPVYSALAQPIPRKFFPAKPDGAYARELPDRIYDVGYATHTAFLNYAEYYIMFGWASLVACSVALGVSLKCLWTWFLWRQYEPLAQACYLLSASYLFVVVSRGYLPQVFMLYGVTIFPLFVMYWLVSQRSRGLNSSDIGKNVVSR